MAQEQTVQGAAKKITGLLNPDKGQSEPAKPAEPEVAERDSKDIGEDESSKDLGSDASDIHRS